MSKLLIYTISLPEDTDSEQWADFFNWLEIEGVQEDENGIEIYVLEENVPDLEGHIEFLRDTYTFEVQRREAEEKNWNETWEKSFEPVKIGNLAGIRASFHAPLEDVEYDIVIDPKMSFGTGHHATTHQVMSMMNRIGIQDKKMLDLGSGTGILAILAEKMGAASVLAIDNDPWCYENNLENNLLNKAAKVIPVLGTLESANNDTFEVILANIQRNFLLDNMKNLAKSLTEKGKIIISGFMPGDVKDLLNAALECNLIALYHTSMHQWECILLEKHQL